MLFPAFHFVPLPFLSLSITEKNTAPQFLFSLFRWLHTLVRFPWSFSSPVEQSQPSLSPPMSDAPVPLSLWSFIALLPVYLCLSCTVETTTRYNTACCLLTPTEERGRIIPSWLAGNAPFNAFRDAFSNLCCKSTMLTHVYQYSLVLL